MISGNVYGRPYPLYLCPSCSTVFVISEHIPDGLAWFYGQYCKSSFCSQRKYLEEDARSRKIGLLPMQNPILPWEFRCSGKTGTSKAGTTTQGNQQAGPYHGNTSSRIFHQSGCKMFDCKNCTEVVQCPPPKIGELKPKSFEISLMKTLNSLGCGRLLKWSGMTDRMAVKGFVKFPFTEIANFTGQPAMSVPLHWTVNQLPIGVQFIAPFGDEATLFRLASQLEKAKPWFDKMPSIAE